LSIAAPISLAGALGLYVHWPYCARICPYCDFNVYRPKDEGDALLAAMLDDMEAWRRRTGARRLASLHFGGGTPSLMRPDQLAAVIGTADRLWGLEEGAEIGLEANPKDMAGFAGMAGAGVNRLSLGVQSFDDAALAALGRDHDGPMARRAIDAAQAAFSRVSIDMIYARAGQTAADWESELRHALATGVGHLSPYQLTIETGTAFGKRAARGERLAAPPDFAADLFELTQAVCEAEGLPAYEISNHARSRADRSAHNRLYWEGGDWIGIGPGAHGRIGRASAGGRIATEAARRPADYVRSAVRHTEDVLEPADETAERILMGMRLGEGLDLAELAAATGATVDPAGLERMQRQGLVERAGSRVRLTPAGRLLADGVSAELVP
jgi:oxygen-independent coproporphyrinogen-3 oxidase